MKTENWDTDAINSPNITNVEDRNRNESVFDLTKHTVAEKLWNVSEKLQRQSNRTDINPEFSRYGQQTADWLGRSADYINDLNPQQLKADVQNQVRANPGRTLLIAGGIGLLLGSVLRRR